MPTFEQGDVIRVPFPYTDRDTRQRRPALVVSAGAIGEDGALLWVVMITSAENRPWPGDVPVPDQVGLPAPSVVRPVKIATIEARHADFLGRLPTKEHEKVMQHVGRLMGYRAHTLASWATESHFRASAATADIDAARNVLDRLDADDKRHGKKP